MTFNRSSSSSFRTPSPSHVKIEPSMDNVTLLSSDSEADSPEVIAKVETPSSMPTLPIHTTPQYVPSERSRIQDKTVSSVIECLKGLRHLKGSRNVLSKIDYDAIDIHTVHILPPSFNGDVIFELPAANTCNTSSQAKQMAGMDKRYDGHVWTKTKTTNIVNHSGLTFRTSVCIGHVRCMNSTCAFLNRVHHLNDVNELEWEGMSVVPLDVGDKHPPSSTLLCKFCKEPPCCIARCNARVYYVCGNSTLTRAFIHLGIHKHPVKDGELRDMQERTRDLIGEQMERTPSATNSAIIMDATKELLGDLLLRPDGELPKTLDLSKLMPVLDKCKYFSSPSIRNEVTSFKHLRRFGVVDSIMKLKGSSTWAFVQESKFPGQGTDTDKVFVFKMSEVGPGSGVDLVKRMQVGGDLQDTWVMFDHVKRVRRWTTMACHVYDSSYCRVMTIACSDMQSEDCAAQILFWQNLNSVLARSGVPKTNFKGFMADNAQANWNAVRVVYGSGNIAEPMENRERTCLFHWTQSMEKHTVADIRRDLQDQHRILCKQYKNAISPEDSETQYLAIKAWWLSYGACSGEGLKRLELWLAFWHFRYRQWGGVTEIVSLHEH